MYSVDYGGIPVHDPGRGLLATSCTIKESADAAAVVSMSLPPGHPASGSFEPMSCSRELTVRDGGEVVFSGRVTSVEESPLDGSCTVSAEDASAYLNDTIQEPYENYNAPNQNWDAHINAPSDAGELFAFMIERHNRQCHADAKVLQVGINVGGAFGEVERASGQRQTTKAELRDKLLSLGGYLHVDYSHVPRRIDWLGENGLGNAPQGVTFAVNLLDVTRKRGNTDLITAIVPVGSASGGGSEVTLQGGESVPGAYRVEDGMVIDIDAAARYGVIAKSETYETSDPQALAEDACDDIARLALGLEQVEVSALDLHALDGSVPSVRVLEWVTVTLGDGRATQMMCTGRTVDVCEPAKTMFSFGAKLHTLVGGVTRASERIREAGTDVSIAKAEAASRSRVFRGAEPTPPYSDGDLWCTDDGKIYVCKTAKEV